MTSPIPAGVTAISFDIWGTLLRGNKAFSKRRVQLIFDTLGIAYGDLDQLVKAYKRADQHFNDKAEQDLHDYGMVERLEHMFHALGITAELPDPDTVAALQAKIGELRIQDQFLPQLIEHDIHTTLLTLRQQGYAIGLLSNTGMDNGRIMRPLLDKLGLLGLFAAAVFSADDGRAKPNPSLFVSMATELGVEPRQTLHIGDNANADYRATEAGCHALLYAPDGSELTHVRSMRELIC